MSKADEMFEELGYIKTDETEIYIKYESKIDEAVIWFDKRDNTVSCANIKNMAIDISMKELQAINEKVKELGWNE